MNEADTCRLLVIPKIEAAGWDRDPARIGKEVTFTDGRILVAGGRARRRPGKRADFILRYRAGMPLAVVEAKPDTAPVAAERLLTPAYHLSGKTPRYCQEIAINRAVEAVVRGQRGILLTMATGTGKTLVAFQVCLVIVDECHRGSAKDDSSWREILAYFAPAVQIGMTATPPARRDPRHLPLFRKPGLSVQSQAGHRRRFPRAVPCPSRCHAMGCLRMAPQQGRPRPQEPARQRGQHAPAAGTTGRKHSGEGTADCGDYGEDRGSAGRASEGVTFSR